MKAVTLALGAILIPLSFSGCSLTQQLSDPSDLPLNHVQSVMTEHSLALACLGELIEQTDRPQLTVYIDDIEDTTVPPRFRKRRLSSGGSWWLHNAIIRLETDRVISQTGKGEKDKSPQHILLSGAWTQDDQAVERMDASLGGEGRSDSGSTRGSFLFGGNRSRDVIAGDFLTIRDGQVLHASAISVALSSGRSGIGLDIQDGSWRSSFDISRRINEGPQFAQRRIAEAAALVHIARAFDLDYRPCAELDWASPTSYQALTGRYLNLPERERLRLLQEALADAGYEPGEVDGVWGQRSVSALMAFQSDKGLAVTGHPSVTAYVAIRALGQADPALYSATPETL